jgi:hypothetical protein
LLLNFYYILKLLAGEIRLYPFSGKYSLISAYSLIEILAGFGEILQAVLPQILSTGHQRRAVSLDNQEILSNASIVRN